MGDSDKYRTGDLSKGDDALAERNASDMAIGQLKKYDIAKSDVNRDMTYYHRLTARDNEVLDSYAACLADIGKVAEQTGLTRQEIHRVLGKESVQRELADLQDVWRYNRKMKAENAAATHIKFLEQMINDYQALDLNERSKMANPITKATDTYLKASGHMNHGGGGGETNAITINIDLGSDEKVKISNKKDES